MMTNSDFFLPEQQLVVRFEAAKSQLEAARRTIMRLERDNRLLSITNTNAERLRLFNEAEKKLHYLYNDLLLKNCPSMIFLFNEQLRLVLCTQSGIEAFRHTDLHAVQNSTLEDIFSTRMSDHWVTKIHYHCLETISSLRRTSYDDEIVFTDSTSIHAQMSFSPIMDDDALCKGVVISINDTTELNSMKKRAESAAESKSTFLANMSHEIRTPMNAIKGLSELLLMTQLTHRQKEYVRNIVNSSKSLLHIINDILDFSKIDANRMDILSGEYKLADLVHEFTSIVSMRADEKKLLLLVEIDPTLPSVLKGDDVRIKQILLNILSNAVKYTHTGHIKFSMRWEMYGADIRLICSVEDSGIGIPPQDLPYLFDAFARADLHANRAIIGTGLGLAISKRLVLAMGGDISVTSTYGKGTTFTFWVPQERVDSRPLALVPQAEKQKALVLADGLRGEHLCAMLRALAVPFVCCPDKEGLQDIACEEITHCLYYDDASELVHDYRPLLASAGFTAIKELRFSLDQAGDAEQVLYEPVLITALADVLAGDDPAGNDAPCPVAPACDSVYIKGKKALVVDDNEINLMVAEELLLSYGLDVLTAPGGPEGLELCAQRKFDIIFMDHMMPVMDGIEVTQRIRFSQSPNRETPIIALTANVVNTMTDQYAECGMNDFISKPIEIEELSRVLAAWLLTEPHNVNGADAEHDSSASAAPSVCGTGQRGDLVRILDEFGIFASVVVQELNDDKAEYIARLGMASQFLGPLSQRLHAAVKSSAWDDFAREILDLEQLLFAIGARECAGVAKKLHRAVGVDNTLYIRTEFTSLMDNMYMLEKKLIALMTRVSGQQEAALPVNNPVFVYEHLKKMQQALLRHDHHNAVICLEILAGVAFDRTVDKQLKQIKNLLEHKAYAEAMAINSKNIALLESQK